MKHLKNAIVCKETYSLVLHILTDGIIAPLTQIHRNNYIDKQLKFSIALEKFCFKSQSADLREWFQMNMERKACGVIIGFCKRNLKSELPNWFRSSLK